MSAEERAADIKTRLLADIKRTLSTTYESTDLMVEAVVDDAMFHVEHLLVELGAHWAKPGGNMVVCPYCHQPGWMVESHA